MAKITCCCSRRASPPEERTPADQGAQGDERQFLFLCGSARREGNSALLAQAAAAALPSSSKTAWLHLADLGLPPFEDQRHAGGGAFPGPAKGAEMALEATLAATDLVLVAPVYWYGLPASTKLYLDYWSGWLRVPGLHFRDRMAGKRMWAITVVSDPDPAKAEPLLTSLRWTAEYMRMQWGGEIVGFGNRPGDVSADTEAMTAAAQLFRGGGNRTGSERATARAA
jgi:multimeric flavodoxin WrbA